MVVSMRILHTGDWHVGKTIRGRSRMSEYETTLNEVVSIAKQEGVDAVLVAGDLYDRQSPPPEADELVFDVLLRLQAAHIPVVIIPGNHDSAVRFRAIGRLVRPLGIHVVSEPLGPDGGGIVEIGDQRGKDVARIACIPWIPEQRFTDAAQLFGHTGNWYDSYDVGMGKLFERMAEGFQPGQINVLMAHLYVDGAKIGGGEREITTGMAYTVHARRLPKAASYVALGHIHRPQAVKRTAVPARYAGSLLQLDFGEREQEKSVTLVDLSRNRDPRIEMLPVDSGRKLVDVTGTLDKIAQAADSIGDAYARVVVKTDGPVPGIADRVREMIPNALDIEVDYPREEPPLTPSLRSLSPKEQFASYYQHTHGAKPARTLLTAFDRVYRDVKDE